MWTRQPADLVPILSSSGSLLTTSNNKASIHDIDRYLNRFWWALIDFFKNSKQASTNNHSLKFPSHWQSRENPNGDQDPDHWDHALLLTGLDLFAVGRDGFTTHQIVGKMTGEINMPLYSIQSLSETVQGVCATSWILRKAFWFWRMGAFVISVWKNIHSTWMIKTYQLVFTWPFENSYLTFEKNITLGLAPIGGMCTATSSCTVNEGRHFESVYVVAHEIGHKYRTVTILISTKYLKRFSSTALEWNMMDAKQETIATQEAF